MDDKQKMSIVRILFLLSGIIIFLAALYLLVLGDTSDKIIGVIGVVLVIAEAILYKKGYILQ